MMEREVGGGNKRIFCFDLPRECAVCCSYVPTHCTDVYATYCVLHVLNNARACVCVRAKEYYYKSVTREQSCCSGGQFPFLNLSSLESKTANSTAGESEVGYQPPAAFASCNITRKLFLPSGCRWVGAVLSPTGKRRVVGDVVLSRYLIVRAADSELNSHSIWGVAIHREACDVQYDVIRAACL